MPDRSSILGRGNYALGNLAHGDLRAGLRSILDPASLSPVEAQTLVERMQLAKNDTFMKGVLEAVTNPFVIIGAAFSIRYPVVKLSKMFKVGEAIKRADKAPWFGPLFTKLRSPISVMRGVTTAAGESVPEAILDAGMNKSAFLHKYRSRIRDSIGVYEQQAGKSLTHRDLHITALHLDGLADEVVAAERFRKIRIGKSRIESPIDAQAVQDATSPELHTWIKGVRKTMTGIFDELILRDPALHDEIAGAMTRKYKKMTRETVLKKLNAGTLDVPTDVMDRLRTSKAYKSVVRKAASEGLMQPGDFLQDYLPHSLPRNLMEYDKWLMEMVSAHGSNAQRLAKGQAAGIGNVGTERFLKRFDRMVPNMQDLEKYPEFLHPERAQKFVDFLEETSTAQRAPVPYTMDLDETLSNYFHQTSVTYGLNKNGAGRILKTAKDELELAGDHMRAGMLENEIIPEVAGRPTFQQAVKGSWQAAVQRRIREYADEPLVSKALGPKMHKWVTDNLDKQGGPFSLSKLDSNLASFMYHGALGGNVGSITMQAMQTLVTTVPMLGKYAAVGLGRTLKNVPKYMEKRMKGLDHYDALVDTFPDFVTSGLGHADKMAQEVSDALSVSYELARKSPRTASAVTKGWTRAKQGLMFFFEKFENINQLSAFEGAMAKGMAEGLTREASMPLARRVVMETQFPSAPGNVPMWISNWKQMPFGKSLTMFSQFTWRFAEFAGSTAQALGSGEKAGLFGKNWGTLGRMSLTSGLAYELGKSVLGTDLSQGLAGGAFPSPREGAPFSPIPWVPPILNVPGTIVQDMMAGNLGNLDKTRYALPVLVPGGVAAARAISYASPELAKKLGRKYVDYNQPSPDGTYAVYSASKPETPTLVGHMTGPEIIASALGFPGRGQAGREPEALNWMMQNRDRISEYKKGYLNALLANDYGRARDINEDFKRSYPGHGGINSLLKKQDIQAMQLRRRVTRMERVLNTLPKEMRQDFAFMIQSAVLNSGSNFLGIDPALLQHGTIRQRHGMAGRGSGGGSVGKRGTPNLSRTRQASAGLPSATGNLLPSNVGTP